MRAPLSPMLHRLCALSVLVGAALSPVAPAAAMDLREAYAAALANDATVRAARAAAEATRERLPQAQSQRRLSISLSAGRTYNDLTSESSNSAGKPVTNTSNYYSGNQVLTVRQAIYRPFASALVRQAEAQVEDAGATLEREEQGLVVRVGETYFDALLAEDQLLLVQSQKKNYTIQLDAAKKGFAAGSGTRTDIDDAQAKLDMTLAQELEVRQNLDFTRRRLEVLTGQADARIAPLNVAAFMPRPPDPVSLQAWIERAEQSSPEIASLRAQVEVANQEIDKAQAGHMPTLDAVAQWARTNSDSVSSVNTRYDNRTIGLQLTVPIYSGGYTSSTVRAAVASRERAIDLLEATRRDLGVRVHREFRGMTEGVLRIAALEQAARSADQAVLSNKRSFEAGLRTTIDLLNAEQQRTLTLRDLAQARYQYLVSRLRLSALAGEDKDANVAVANSSLGS